MTEHLHYKLQLGVSDGADVEEIEEFMQQLLLDLYEQGQVESIRVTKNGHTVQDDEELEKVLDILDEMDSQNVKNAIDSVKKLEDEGEVDDDE